jgi:hypothetical protein
MEVGLDIEIEMAHRTLGIALVEGSCLLTAEASFHDIAQHRRARLVEVCGEVVHFCPCHRVKAGIRADAGARLTGPMIGW